jgi:hypothetical protein
MKTVRSAVAFVCLCLATTASADPVATVEVQSPLLGTWVLDLTRMPDANGPLPKRVTYAWADLGQGVWEGTVDIVAPDGGVRHMASRYTRDGRAVRIEGDQLEADSVAVTTPAPNILVMGLAKGNRPGSTRVYSVSANGMELTESAVSVGDDGMPLVRTFHFTRMEPPAAR